MSINSNTVQFKSFLRENNLLFYGSAVFNDLNLSKYVRRITGGVHSPLFS